MTWDSRSIGAFYSMIHSRTARRDLCGRKEERGGHGTVESKLVIVATGGGEWWKDVWFQRYGGACDVALEVAEAQLLEETMMADLGDIGVKH